MFSYDHLSVDNLLGKLEKTAPKFLSFSCLPMALHLVLDSWEIFPIHFGMFISLSLCMYGLVNHSAENFMGEAFLSHLEDSISQQASWDFYILSVVSPTLRFKCCMTDVPIRIGHLKISLLSAF